MAEREAAAEAADTYAQLLDSSRRILPRYWRAGCRAERPIVISPALIESRADSVRRALCRNPFGPYRRISLLSKDFGKLGCVMKELLTPGIHLAEEAEKFAGADHRQVSAERRIAASARRRRTRNLTMLRRHYWPTRSIQPRCRARRERRRHHRQILPDLGIDR